MTKIMTSNGSFVEISDDRAKKLKFLGYCQKCKKQTNQRFTGAGMDYNWFKCMECKTRNKEER